MMYPVYMSSMSSISTNSKSPIILLSYPLHPPPLLSHFLPIPIGPAAFVYYPSATFGFPIQSKRVGHSLAPAPSAQNQKKK